MKSILALVAFGLFVFNAITIGNGATGYVGDPPNQTPIGDAGVMGIYSLFRAAFAGLAILSLAIVEWEKVWAAARQWFEDSRPGG